MPSTEPPHPSPPAFVPHRVRGIVFDLDGTLVDSYEAIASSANHALARLGMAPRTTAEIRAMVGRGLEDLMERLAGPERAGEAVGLFRERYARIFRSTTHLLPGVAAALDVLAARGFRMTVASNKPAAFGEAILREFGLLDRFDLVQGPDRAGSTKPDPGMIRSCLEAMRVLPGGGLYVGDMVLDVESAANAGVPVVLVRGGSAGDGALDATGQLVVRDLPALAALLS